MIQSATHPFDEVEPPETWLPVVSYEGFYEVSDLGRVRSLRRFVERQNRFYGGKILKLCPNEDGYFRVGLSRNGRVWHVAIHRLVGEAFIGPLPDGQQTRHKDGNRQNNTLSNLEYGTAAENSHDQKRHETDPLGMRNSRAKLTDDDVRAIRQARAARSATQKALAAHYGVSESSLSSVVRRETWKHVA